MMKRLVHLVVPLGVVAGYAAPAVAIPQDCPVAPGGGETSARICEPPDPPPEPNRLAGPDGNPMPNQNRCGDNQIPVSDCPAYQNLAFFTNHCINGTEYSYAQSHSIAPLCSQLNPTVYIGFCYCGCLERSTGILTVDPGSGKASSQRIDSIVVGAQVHALTGGATLSALQFAPRGVAATTAGGEKTPLVVLHLADGATLSATEQHAILLSTGMMVAAKDLQVGQRMVRQDGSPSEIRQITREPTSDDVYNVLTDAGLVHKEHVIVAGGLLVGDLMWQNTLAKDLNAIIVRQ